MEKEIKRTATHRVVQVSPTQIKVIRLNAENRDTLPTMEELKRAENFRSELELIRIERERRAAQQEFRTTFIPFLIGTVSGTALFGIVFSVCWKLSFVVWPA